MPPVPELADDTVGEILIRMPLDDPACLIRASLVCKSWRRVLADPAFRRRHRALQRTPLVLGCIHNVRDSLPCSSFVRIDPGPGRPAARNFPGWNVLDCRHGRALFLIAPIGRGPCEAFELDFVIWDPLTNEQQRLPRPSALPLRTAGFNAAVLCAAPAEICDHRECHRDPFRVVVIISTRIRPNEVVTFASVYSSESGDWSEPTAVHHPNAYASTFPCPTALVGDALCFRGYRNEVFKYQLATRRLSVIDRPIYQGTSILLMSAFDGRLGFAAMENNQGLNLCLWSRETSPDGVEQWARRGSFEMLLDNGVNLVPWLTPAKVVGYAEGTDVLFVGTSTKDATVYMVQLDSGRFTKVLDGCSTCIFPYTSFCISVSDAPSTAEVPREGVSGA